MNKRSDNGFFGEYGGQYIAEILRPALKELETSYNHYRNDKDFIEEFHSTLKNFVGRPTPLLFAENVTKLIGGADIYLKLEGLANTGAHKINNAVGQALLAKKMGKKKIIAETGAGQHGVATASACARLGLECEIFMGEIDVARQRPNVFWMEMFGAKVTPVTSGTKTLKDAVNEALREWSKRKDDTFYILGSALGPYPYPDMVRDFQSIIGREVRDQMKGYFNNLPDAMVACVGGGSNSIGFFTEFLDDTSVTLIGVEAGGIGDNPGEHASRITGEGGSTGIVQGYKSIFLQDDNGQLLATHSISAGLDYAGIGPQLAYLADTKRITFTKAYDNEVIEALQLFAKHEGIIPALESSHALAAAIKIAKEYGAGKKIIVNVSGRGDKDIFIVAKALGGDVWLNFLKQEIVRIEGGM
ncbi:MAG: tryptophan synthase subunit beta [Spirochaetes bacterium GWF1_31_7]|nr:MAG: tryptophan synthase subunit beta [Spirochaetes bacterium GWE1_32_154]OHD44646.1 MAG: tryptophan synthase subunit beta [Spirochaetes bacterium GWE2_31_10]OHD51758.1 MAG: tryptophan synthase subunit beta [Spirochaetes bacterium GWF1_31_7]OHD80670.1 MAG: tryptophan synthase subunit beta [Spirochaetes bacterium RIFOXYB1_FULL_32_8]HBD94099.1 tryptophan synthase subunit beta [Spirochaetia bacterium]